MSRVLQQGAPFPPQGLYAQTCRCHFKPLQAQQILSSFLRVETLGACLTLCLLIKRCPPPWPHLPAVRRSFSAVARTAACTPPLCESLTHI